MYPIPPTSIDWQQLEEYISRNNIDGFNGQKLSRKRELLSHSSPYSAIYLIDEKTKQGEWYFLEKQGIYLGDGCFAKVKLAYSATGKVYALKIQKDTISPEHIEQEINSLKNLNRYYAFAEREIADCTKYYFLQELILGEPMSQINIMELSLSKQALIIYLLLVNLNKLHTNYIAHGDINERNIMIDIKENNILVNFVDFGLSQVSYKALNKKKLYQDILDLLQLIKKSFAIDDLILTKNLPGNFLIILGEIEQSGPACEHLLHKLIKAVYNWLLETKKAGIEQKLTIE